MAIIWPIFVYKHRYVRIHENFHDDIEWAHQAGDKILPQKYYLDREKKTKLE